METDVQQEILGKEIELSFPKMLLYIFYYVACLSKQLSMTDVFKTDVLQACSNRNPSIDFHSMTSLSKIKFKKKKKEKKVIFKDYLSIIFPLFMQSTKLTSEISTYYIWNDTTWPYSFCSWCSSSGKSVFLIFPWEFYSSSSFRCIILLKTCNDNLNTEWDHTHMKKRAIIF